MKANTFGENEERDILNTFDEKFYDLCDEEDLDELNSEWLRKLPELVVMPREQLQAEVERRAAALPDREERIARALANEPRYMKLIRALCEQAGQELSRVTAGDPTHEHEGQPIVAWHFLTNVGHFYMVDVDGKGIMFHGDTHETIVEIEAGEEFGAE